MANIPRYTDKDFNNEGHKVDFNLRKVFDMPNIEVSDFTMSDYLYYCSK